MKSSKAQARTLRHINDLGWAAPFVVARRMTEFAAAPTAWHHREWQRMHAEKWEAWARGSLDAWMALWRTPFATTGAWPNPFPDPWSVWAAAIGPTRHRAVANMKRLSRR